MERTLHVRAEVEREGVKPRLLSWERDLVVYKGTTPVHAGFPRAGWAATDPPCSLIATLTAGLRVVRL